jgi:hypothetical protein
LPFHRPTDVANGIGGVAQAIPALNLKIKLFWHWTCGGTESDHLRFENGLKMA